MKKLKYLVLFLLVTASGAPPADIPFRRGADIIDETIFAKLRYRQADRDVIKNLVSAIEDRDFSIGVSIGKHCTLDILRNNDGRDSQYCKAADMKFADAIVWYRKRGK